MRAAVFLAASDVGFKHDRQGNDRHDGDAVEQDVAVHLIGEGLGGIFVEVMKKMDLSRVFGSAPKRTMSGQKFKDMVRKGWD